MTLAPDLTANWLEGERTADLEAVAEELAPRLLRYTLGLVQDRAVAEEAAQEALVALVQRWRRHGPPEVPAAFAFAVARRRAYRDIWRRRLLAPIGGWRERDEPSVEARATGRLEAAQALVALRGLARREREALLLVAVGGLGMEAAASVLGLSVSAFKMRLHRARKALRERMEGGDGARE
jgi:RNA polymerase sigma-70 factor (ECF subfamily)